MSITVTFVCDATEHKYAFPYEGFHKFGSFSMECTNAEIVYHYITILLYHCTSILH